MVYKNTIKYINVNHKLLENVQYLRLFNQNQAKKNHSFRPALPC